MDDRGNCGAIYRLLLTTTYVNFKINDSKYICTSNILTEYLKQ